MTRSDWKAYLHHLAHGSPKYAGSVGTRLDAYNSGDYVGCLSGGRVLCSDGKVRRLTKIHHLSTYPNYGVIWIDDFTAVDRVDATVRVRGRSVSGWVTGFDSWTTDTPEQPAIFRFLANPHARNHDLLPSDDDVG